MLRGHDRGLCGRWFIAAFRDVTGVDPPYPAAQAFAAGVLACRCLRNSGAVDEVSQLAAGLARSQRKRHEAQRRRECRHQDGNETLHRAQDDGLLDPCLRFVPHDSSDSEAAREL